MKADGSDQTRVTDIPGDDFSPIWSPDGNRIAFTSCFPRKPEEGEERFGICNIYVVNSDGSSPINLTDDVADDRDPTWSPDGSQIAFSRYVLPSRDIYVVNADGSGLTNVTKSPEADDSEPDWSPLR